MNSQITKSFQRFVLNASTRGVPISSLHQNATRTACCHLTYVTSNAVHKLQIAVEQYRLENYAQELPSRCKKEIVRAADINKDGSIGEEELTKILCNIGASESLSKQELRNIIQELGDSQSQTISVHQMFKIL